MELEVKKLGFPRARQVTLKGVFASVDLCIKAGAFLQIQQFFFSFSSVIVGSSSSSSSHKSSSSFLSVFNSFSSRSRFPQKSLRQAFKFLQEVSTLVWYISYSIVSIFLRRIESCSCSPMTNYINTPQVRRNTSVLIVTLRDFLEYQWFQSGRNNE